MARVRWATRQPQPLAAETAGVAAEETQRICRLAGLRQITRPIGCPRIQTLFPVGFPFKCMTLLPRRALVVAAAAVPQSAVKSPEHLPTYGAI
jgi:hypothetical protein